MFAFGQPESGDEAIAPSLKGKRIGDSDGRRREGEATKAVMEMVLDINTLL